MKAYNSDITIEEFIARHAKPYDAATDNYFREPFANVPCPQARTLGLSGLLQPR
jgi:hypothetical protein